MADDRSPRRVPQLPMREGGASGAAAGWLFRGHRLDLPAHPKTHPWYVVLWLTGVDYFSTLGYQPGIALLAAGALSPLATLILVGVTLLGALPVYWQVAGRSFAGQGSIAMLEGLLTGWAGKIFVLILLGFAATDFVITMTLSAADASQHAIENPILHPYLGEARIMLTCALLALLAAVFVKGFGEAIGLAAAVGIPYILLNLVVLGRCLVEIARDPALLGGWRDATVLRGDPATLALAAALVFPKLALGLSGFETGVSVMPLISGGQRGREDRPEERIRGARRLLLTAALMMSGLLLLSSTVTTLLVPPEAYAQGGPAAGRALAYLAHRYLGPGFGSVYDLSTIVILWFAGASAMAGLLHVVPRYLPRFGMAPEWISYPRPLVLVLFAICLIVTWAFQADVEAQGGAYATGVLVLILSGAVAVSLALWRERRRLAFYFWAVSAVLAYTLVDNVIERPAGVAIAAAFIAFTLAVSVASRYRRATELRVSEANFADEASARLWASIVGKRVSLVPLKTWSAEARARKLAEIRRHYALTGPIAFIHVRLLDNRSEFLSPLTIRVSREGDATMIEASGAVAIANTIAYISELIDPISLFLGLTRKNMLSQAIRFVLWGEGETGMMVYAILVRHWEWTVEEDVRPLIFLMSE